MDHPIDRAAKILGTQAALASALGVTKSAVTQWKPSEGHPDRRVPAEHCPDIERLTEGAVRCEDLRPDVSWAVLRSQSAVKRARQAKARRTESDSDALDVVIRDDGTVVPNERDPANARLYIAPKRRRADKAQSLKQD